MPREPAGRCAAARAKNEAIPEAILFRRMLTHDDYHSCAAVAAEEQAHCDEAPLGGPGSSVEVYCGAEVAQEVAGRPEELQRYTGLQLTAALAAHTSELRLFFSRDSPPLVLGESEVAHFRSFLQVTVVLVVIRKKESQKKTSTKFLRMDDTSSHTLSRRPRVRRSDLPPSQTGLSAELLSHLSRR